VKTQAEIMKIPSSAASMAYSGQCLAKVAAARWNGEAALSEIGGEVISSMLVTCMGYERTREVTENFSCHRSCLAQCRSDSEESGERRNLVSYKAGQNSPCGACVAEFPGHANMHGVTDQPDDVEVMQSMPDAVLKLSA